MDLPSQVIQQQEGKKTEREELKPAGMNGVGSLRKGLLPEAVAHTSSYPLFFEPPSTLSLFRCVPAKDLVKELARI